MRKPKRRNGKILTFHLVTTGKGKRMAAQIAKAYDKWSDPGQDMDLHMYPTELNNTITLEACTAAGDALLTIEGYVDEITYNAFTLEECISSMLTSNGHDPSTFNAKKILKELQGKGYVKKAELWIREEDVDASAIE